MAKKKVKLYNPMKDTTHEFDADHAERILAYQKKVNSKTKYERVKKKSETEED